MMRSILLNIQSIETSQNTRDVILDWILEGTVDDNTKLINVDGTIIGSITSPF